MRRNKILVLITIILVLVLLLKSLFLDSYKPSDEELEIYNIIEEIIEKKSNFIVNQKIVKIEVNNKYNEENVKDKNNISEVDILELKEDNYKYKVKVRKYLFYILPIGDKNYYRG